MTRKIVTWIKEQTRLLVRVRQPEAVVVELLVTVTAQAEPGLRLWARRQGVDIEPAAHQEVDRGLSPLRLRQVQVLEGRTSISVSDKTVAAWLDDLQHRPGITVGSTAQQPVPPAAWRDVRMRGSRELLEVVLVPDDKEQRILEDVAVRQGKNVSEVRYTEHRSWAMRSAQDRSFWVVISLVFLLLPVAMAEVTLPRFRNLVLLVVCLLLVVRGLVYLVKDQGVRVVGTQLAVLGAALAATCYQATRYAYETYYERLRTTPEQVGLDYRSILSNQPFFVLSVALIALLVVLVLYTLVKMLWNGPSLPLAIKALLLVVLGTYAYFLTPVLTARALWGNANRAADAVRAGGSPSTRGIFVWPDPARVALAAPPTSPSGVQQSAYATTLADADLRLLGGDASSWFVLDSVTGSTFPLPRASSPLLIADGGIDRIVTLTGVGIRPGRVVVPPGKPQKVAIYNETDAACMMAAGPYQVEEHGSTFIVMVSVSPQTEVAVQLTCQSADKAGTTFLRTVSLVAGQE